jgi:hypothetical protein
MEQDFEEGLRSLIESASSVDRERTRLTREALLSLVQHIPDQKTAARILTNFTHAHDALEAAIMKGSPEADIATRRDACLATLGEFEIRH